MCGTLWCVNVFFASHKARSIDVKSCDGIKAIYIFVYQQGASRFYDPLPRYPNSSLDYTRMDRDQILTASVLDPEEEVQFQVAAAPSVLLLHLNLYV